MKDNILHFKVLEILRMPGFRSGFTIQDLQPGINVIYGPNASGKTTTITAMNALLWPREAPRQAEVSGLFELDGVPWTTELIGNQCKYQREGQPHERPILPTTESRSRYNLSLHTLLSVDNSRYADAIMREMAGNYDISAAASEVGVRDKPSRSIKESNEVKSAQKNYKEARKIQEKLQDEERKLTSLYKDRNDAIQASEKVLIIKNAIDYVDTKQQFDAAVKQLSVFPTNMDQLNEDDESQLEELTSYLNDEEAKETHNNHTIKNLELEIKECALPSEGVSKGLITNLREKHKGLGDLDRSIKELKRELSGEIRKVQDAANRIGKSIDSSRLASVNIEGFGEVANFARKAELARIQNQVITTEIGTIQLPESVDDLNVLREGRGLLAKWMRSQLSQTNRTTLPMWMLLLIVGVFLLISFASVFSGLWAVLNFP